MARALHSHPGIDSALDIAGRFRPVRRLAPAHRFEELS
jgi:hypothetical protein